MVIESVDQAGECAGSGGVCEVRSHRCGRVLPVRGGWLCVPTWLSEWLGPAARRYFVKASVYVSSVATDGKRCLLECGILAHGFLRLRCVSCAHEKLVAFSCKRRGFCLSSANIDVAPISPGASRRPIRRSTTLFQASIHDASHQGPISRGRARPPLIDAGTLPSG